MVTMRTGGAKYQKFEKSHFDYDRGRESLSEEWNV